MRNVISLNDNWRFTKRNGEPVRELPKDWQRVCLPHTWNGIDGQGGAETYDRGRYWYARAFETPCQPLPGGRVYVEVLAAGQQADVYVNGILAASHEGGYSAFRVDVTELCLEGETNLLAIACSNEYRDNVYPQSADFTFYGGLYRGVNLISVPETHFDLDYYGGPGLKVTPKPCEQGGAVFEVESWVNNPSTDFTVMYSVRDTEDREVAAAVRPATDTGTVVYIPDVVRWEMEHPYLYTVTATLQYRNEAYDEVIARVGVRSYSVDPQEGFCINGRRIPLRGVCRHQDMLYRGNALGREDHYRDAKLIKELGANTIRLAHYQHSQDFYDACDELGFAVWAEIPFISVFNPNPEAHLNCISQMKELIIQNYHHPSIMFWGLSNEITMGGMSDRMVENHEELNELCHRLDPTRLTTMAHVSSVPPDSPLHGISDLESYNLYFGWYEKNMEANGPWLDHFHEEHPDLCLGLSEYGCEGILTYHNGSSACKDYSEEYQARYHEHMAKVISERKYLWATHIWNMFDFGVAARNEGGVRGRNNKGLMTIDRKTKKDSYFIYQAYWTTQPMVHICGRRYAQRAGETTEIRVYSNQPAVALSVNGKPAGEKTGDKVFVFQVSLEKGSNTILAQAGSAQDSITLEKVEEEPAVYSLEGAPGREKHADNWFKSSEEKRENGGKSLQATLT